MHKDSVWYHFHPDSVGWLHRKVVEGEFISAEDVARIVEANPDTVSDALLRELILEGLRGKLKRSVGRPSRTMKTERRLIAAAIYLDILKRWQQRAKERGYPSAYKRKGPADLSFSEHAHNVVARKCGFASGEALANAISAQKNQRPFLTSERKKRS